MAQQPLADHGVLSIMASLSHSDTPHLLGLIWTGDQPIAENSTWRNQTPTTDELPCPRRHSKQQSQQASVGKPKP